MKLAPQLLAGVLVFLAAFGLFATTTSSLTGYEDETAAVTEGLVLNGQFYETERANQKWCSNHCGTRARVARHTDAKA